MGQMIWIFNHYATDTFFDRGGRHYNFAKYLIKDNKDVRIFCASTVHNSDINIGIDGEYAEKSVNDIPYTFLRTPAYTGNGLRRILNMYAYYSGLFKVYKEYISRGEHPDVIIASSVHPLALVAGIRIAKQLNIPCICEIRDIWPETLIAYDKISENSPLTKLLYARKKWIYYRADAIIYTMPDGIQCIIDKGWDKDIDLSKVYNINNGVDLEMFQRNANENVVNDSDLDDDTFIKLVYTGSVREANCVGFLLDLAEAIKFDNRFRILVFGGGDQLQRLIDDAHERSLDNIIFKGRFEKKYIPSILRKGDANIMIGKEGLGVSKYGLSLNKMFEYMASGKPILTNFREGKTKIIGDPNRLIGVIKSIDSPDEFAKGIIELFNDPHKYKELVDNELRAVEEYDFKLLTKKLSNVIDTTIDRFNYTNKA